MEKACARFLIFSRLFGLISIKIHTPFTLALWGRGDLVSFLVECIVLGNGLLY